METKQRPMDTKEGQQTPMKNKRDHQRDPWRPREIPGDQALTTASGIMQMIHRYCVAYIMNVLLLCILIILQVIPVSAATVVQQEPVLLFYKWMDGINISIIFNLIVHDVMIV